MGNPPPGWHLSFHPGGSASPSVCPPRPQIHKVLTKLHSSFSCEHRAPTAEPRVPLGVGGTLLGVSRWGWGPRAQLLGGKSFRTRAGVSRGVCTACFFFLPTFLPFWFAFPSPVPTTRPLALSLGLSPGGRTRAGCPLRVPTPVGDVGSTPQSTPHSHNPLQIPARDAQPKKS